MPLKDVVFANFIKCVDKPRKNSEEPVSFMEVTVVLNAYQNTHSPSLSHLTPILCRSSVSAFELSVLARL